MRRWRKLAMFAGVTAASAAVAQPPQKVTGPVAVYWMSAQTQTGFGMPGGGGVRPSMSQIMRMVTGGGGAQHSLILQLGSSRKTADPTADHLPPTGLGAGSDLPLVTPVVQPSAPHKEEAATPIPREYQRPKGRMLIFWGCGEHAKTGQPIVIDFAQMSAGKMPAGMEALGKGLGVGAVQPPSPSRNATYGEWPNAKSKTSIPSQTTLAGDHLVQGNYSPTIKFQLTPAQDFLGPMTLTTNRKNPTGSAELGWNSVSGAQAYLASAIGGGQDDTVVLWTSSEVQAAAFAIQDYIAPGDLHRLVASQALMGPQTTTCTVPKEVIDAAPQALLQMVAYGSEVNVVFPPRPADPKVAWNQEWQVKVRYRSATGGMLGMTMPGAGGGGDDGERPRRGNRSGQADQPPQSQPMTPDEEKAARRKAILRGLGGVLGLPH